MAKTLWIMWNLLPEWGAGTQTITKLVFDNSMVYRIKNVCQWEVDSWKVMYKFTAQCYVAVDLVQKYCEQTLSILLEETVGKESIDGRNKLVVSIWVFWTLNNGLCEGRKVKWTGRDTIWRNGSNLTHRLMITPV